jgi:L-arabinonolactonase
MKITRIEPFRHKLGEGPVWDAGEQALYGADLLARKIWRYDPVQGDYKDWFLTDQVGSFALRETGGALVALASGLYLFDFATGVRTLIADPCAHDEQVQLNDGKADPAGRFLVGSVHVAGKAGAALHSVGRDHSVTTLDTGYQVTNGPCWSPDGTIFYLADTAAGNIYAYGYDCSTGTASRRRLFANTLGLGGVADGATVDEEGCLWTALCGGSKIVRYDREGSVALAIDMPTPLVSSVMFGGRDLDRLFVTSIDGAAAAREIPMAAANPVPSDENSGALFVVDGLGIRGIAERRFGG